MKTILPVVCVLLFAVGCTETEYLEIEKVVRDTLTIEKYVDRYFAGTDTVTITQVVEVQVPVPARSEADTVIVYETKLDTIYLTRVDTVWRTKVVIEHDTVVVRQYTFGDTLYIYPGRGLYSVPRELQPIVDAFYQDSFDRGLNAYGGHIAITIQDIDEVLQAYSYQTYGQLNIVLNGNQTDDEFFLPIYRELARWQLKKQYSQDPEHPMFPFYPSNVVRYSNRDQHKATIDKIFQ